jgi:GNAT superfamily N-acetyltransferase
MPDSQPDITLIVEDAPNPTDVAYVEDQLNAYSVRVTGYTDYLPLAIFLRGSDGQIVAGLTGFTWGHALKIGYVWVHEDHRRQGYGTRLIQAAEREAVVRGCRQAVLDTHSFQAPNFYPKLGYVRCGLAEDWPVGYRQYYFTKRLA